MHKNCQNLSKRKTVKLTKQCFKGIYRVVINQIYQWYYWYSRSLIKWITNLDFLKKSLKPKFNEIEIIVIKDFLNWLNE